MWNPLRWTNSGLALAKLTMWWPNRGKTPIPFSPKSIDRSGYARGTLATRPGLDAPVPELDPVEWLTMRDMMGAMNHGNSDGGMDHSQMGSRPTSAP